MPFRPETYSRHQDVLRGLGARYSNGRILVLFHCEAFLRENCFNEDVLSGLHSNSLMPVTDIA
jgi:hypothetical protein